jgi:carboxylate-amine ligase
MPATDLVAALLDHVRDALAHTGDLAEVHATIDRLRSGGTGADRQRRIAGAGGLAAVVSQLTLWDETGGSGYPESVPPPEVSHG